MWFAQQSWRTHNSAADRLACCQDRLASGASTQLQAHNALLVNTGPHLQHIEASRIARVLGSWTMELVQPAGTGHDLNGTLCN